MTGRWEFTGEYLKQVPGEDGVFVSPELELLVLDLEHAFRDPDSCIELYVAGGPGLDTASEIGARTTLTGFFAPPAAGEITGGFLGLYHLPGSDISVEVQAFIMPAANDYTVDAFVVECEFEVYPGDAIIAGSLDTPDWDDDGDGEIDEADETELDDIIDPTVMELSRGRIRLIGSRVGALAHIESPQVHAVGSMVEAGMGGERPFAVSFQVPSAQIMLDAGELELAHGKERVRAAARIAAGGCFRAEVPLKIGFGLFEGCVVAGEVVSGRLRILGEDRAALRTFGFEVDLVDEGE
ncbi:MAG: hypothetical protein IPJ77_06060 [Planctomycetes bacterium]|nr:hypothetical protein [Planctomycetota bacterium]